MKKSVTLLLALLLSAGMTFAQSWNLDQSHSNVNFSIAHMVISSTEGDFKSFEINLSQGKENWDDSKVNATIDVSTVNTNNEKRDGHLKSADFFDVENHPSISFESTSFKMKSGNKFEITGNLTMHGVTKEVTFEAKHNGTVKDPWGNTRTGWKATTEIDRTAFGLEYNSALETGGLLIGEEVEITVNVEFVKG